MAPNSTLLNGTSATATTNGQSGAELLRLERVSQFYGRGERQFAAVENIDLV